MDQRKRYSLNEEPKSQYEHEPNDENNHKNARLEVQD